MSYCYITRNDGGKCNCQWWDFWLLYQRESQLQKGIAKIGHIIQDLANDEADIKRIIAALPGCWDRAHAQPVIEKLEDTLTLIKEAKDYYEMIGKDLEMMKMAARTAHAYMIQYDLSSGKNPFYDWKADCYRLRDSSWKMGKWTIHLHVSPTGCEINTH